MNLQVHTFDISHKITKWEAIDIKKKYNVSSTSQLCIIRTNIKGINKIEIKENPKRDSNGNYNGIAYTLCLEINLGKLLNISNIRMVSLCKSNRTNMVKTLNNILINELYLIHKNSNSEEWLLNRVDVGVDVTIPNANNSILELYIETLHKALNLHNNRHCSYHTYLGYNLENNKRESIVFGNNSYRYNIYDKQKELAKKYRELSPMQIEESNGVIRIEKQIFGKGISNGIGSPQRLSLLLDESIIDRVCETIMSDIKLFFGSGTFVSITEAGQRLRQSNYPLDYKHTLFKEMEKYFHNGRNLSIENDINESNNNSKQMKLEKQKYQKDIETLGISTIVIDDTVLKSNGVISLIGLLELVENKMRPKLTQLKRIPREKSKFCKIYFDKKDNRCRCNITYHDEKGKSIRKSLADKNKEKLMCKIYNTLMESYFRSTFIRGKPIEEVTVIQSCIAKDLYNFAQTIDSDEPIVNIIRHSLIKIYNNMEEKIYEETTKRNQ